ncbi:hypothetical protein SEA_LEONARD_8 [Gordonia phage Leonard]|uniref:Uncharacterized protein n=2 Tax=Leonardvirus TaxID=2948800 RepID=A0A649VLS4_9CAUD|nr:hypothetical protein BI045_gp08 [Gordonia phage Phinally]YP_010002227.1 hypothetical protein J1769_gp08 [Gordonia phage Leonard]YP_010002483.1 hypothetical protein J1772_gp06 [Gordonia phage Ali17]AMS03000.1 hypothetical protein SEA_PHINALLY_8 [Gordonia phage Phinally]AXQ60622.1 hypothetical protein SEA_ALI17_6 [Gordonia phage Ali17]QGJ93370.1 hypothetical protein SEA_LEONARD_8 [Gordonia phage Leonard]
MRRCPMHGDDPCSVRTRHCPDPYVRTEPGDMLIAAILGAVFVLVIYAGWLIAG